MVMVVVVGRVMVMIVAMVAMGTATVMAIVSIMFMV